MFLYNFLNKPVVPIEMALIFVFITFFIAKKLNSAWIFAATLWYFFGFIGGFIGFFAFDRLAGNVADS